MADGPGALFFDPEDYLDEDERREASEEKQRELIREGLTPDWFLEQGVYCLPAGLRVAIVGAGLSGLAAAWYLNSLGVDVMLYEAKNRFGGRVLTSSTMIPGGKVIEEGAELIGENHPLWNILAARFRLPLDPLTDDSNYEGRRPSLKVRTRFRGRDLSPAEKAGVKAQLKIALPALGRDGAPINPRRPWDTFRGLVFDRMTVAQRLRLLLGAPVPGPIQDTHDWFELTLGNDNCAPTSRQSFLGLATSISAARMGRSTKGLLGYWLSTETHRCRGGNQRLANALFATLPRAKVRTTTVVERIEVELDLIPPVTIQSLEEGTVRRRELFDAVILAVPPTVWPRITFTPSFSFPDRSIQHGPAIKYIQRFNSRWWEGAPHHLAPLAKWDELGTVWEGTDNQNTPPGFALSVFSGGNFVLPRTIYPGRMASLYPAPPGELLGDRFVDWPSDPDILTGYAIPNRGEVSTVIPRLLTPHRERLYFAGEQCSPGFFGYMEGALQEGSRAARDIVVRWMRRCDGAITV